MKESAQMEQMIVGLLENFGYGHRTPPKICVLNSSFAEGNVKPGTAQRDGYLRGRVSSQYKFRTISPAFLNQASTSFVWKG